MMEVYTNLYPSAMFDSLKGKVALITGGRFRSGQSYG